MKTKPDADHSWPSLLGPRRWLTLHEKLRELKATLKCGNMPSCYTPDILRNLIESMEYIKAHMPPEMRPERKKELRRRNHRMGEMSYGTERALEMVAKGTNPHAAALLAGVSPSTVYVALKRIKDRAKPVVG